jgi:ribonuclease P protein component
VFVFKRIQRILNKAEYDYVFKKAQKIVTSDFIVLYRSNNLGHARLGLALSKKMIAKAHDRNRVKRLIRESFRLRQLPDLDIIFLAKPGVAKQDNSVFYTKLSKTWDQLIAYSNK